MRIVSVDEDSIKSWMEQEKSMLICPKDTTALNDWRIIYYQLLKSYYNSTRYFLKL